MQKDKLIALASERSTPCVSISLSTHRSHPDNGRDVVELRNALQTARERVMKDYDHLAVARLLEQLHSVEQEIHKKESLESLHLFLSNTTKEIIRSPLPVGHTSIQIADSFAIKPLIKAFNRTEEYLILVLSQSDATMLHVIDATIIDTIANDEFPFTHDARNAQHNGSVSDAKHVDNLVREYLKTVDKAVMKLHNATTMQVVVAGTSDNYSRLMQVAETPSVYVGNMHINPHDSPAGGIAPGALQVVKAFRKAQRATAIDEMNEGGGKGLLIRTVADIYRAAKEGRGELLTIRDSYRQAVTMTGEFSFALVTDATVPGVIDDIASEIAWEVLSKKGRALFLEKDEDASLGDIALKVRY